ncbi:MAG TPA: DNA polymerase III subunit gamma/tau [Treponemataceae bacterium]|nr:DNA polymerase III subunit gamma/tau [Treponemataceae bacterium]
MAYEVTATRRRPQKFSDLVGQEFVVATLENAVKNGKTAHAYLFSGPRGCGKTSAARILAKMLNCEKGVERSPCGECSACTEITKGSSLDVIEIDGASNTSVNDVRQIKDEVLFSPNSCTYKIYIIDEVHMLSTSAFNALLKTIEEPPPYVVFIFATTEIHKVPATIKSRCQQFSFRLGSIEQIKGLLEQTVQDNKIEADDEALYWIAREATGSFRDAYTLFDQVAAFSEGNITYDRIREKLGLTGVEQLNELCETCIQANTANALEHLDTILQRGVSIEQFITNLTDYFRNILLIKTGIKKESLLGHAAERYSTEVLNAWTLAQIEHGFSLFLQLFRDVRYSLNPRYELELHISRLCWLKDWVSAKEMQKAISDAQNLLEGDGAHAVQEPEISQSNHNPSQNTSPGMNTFSMLDNSTKKEPSRPFVNGGISSTDAAPPISTQSKNEIEHASIMQNDSTFQSTKSAEEIPFSDVIQNKNFGLKELKEAVINEFARKEPLIASALMQTKNWILNGNEIIASVYQVFTKQQLDTGRKKINALLSHIWQKKISFKATLHKEKKVEKQIPLSVECVCDVFKGTIISTNTQKKREGEKNEI